MNAAVVQEIATSLIIKLNLIKEDGIGKNPYFLGKPQPTQAFVEFWVSVIFLPSYVYSERKLVLQRTYKLLITENNCLSNGYNP